MVAPPIQQGWVAVDQGWFPAFSVLPQCFPSELSVRALPQCSPEVLCLRAVSQCSPSLFFLSALPQCVSSVLSLSDLPCLSADNKI